MVVGEGKIGVEVDLDTLQVRVRLSKVSIM